MITVTLPKLEKKHYKEAISLLSEKNESFLTAIQKAQDPIYKSWEKIKFNPNFKPETLWAGIEFIRNTNYEKTIIKAENNKNFQFWELPRYRKFFHDFDSIAHGKIFNIDTTHKQIFIQNGILEEAIQSSKIEGAVTTRKEAQKMIQEHRKPKNKSDQMILNNYETIQKIQSKWKEESMSLSLLFEIHFSITQKTDLNEDSQFRFRKNSDKINVWDNQKNEIIHNCPNEKFVKKEIETLIKFANDETETDFQFLHPLVKAVMLHFWIGYLHPFVDGNGRTARAIFYWYLLKNGYWAIPFIPISNKIIKSQKQYRDAFLFAEQVDYDFNYFFDYNVRQLQLSMNDFLIKLKNQKEAKETESLFLKQNFNARQIELLKYFWTHPKRNTTFFVHQSFHKIHTLTARKDILELEKKALVTRQKIGKTIYFFPNSEAINKLFL